MLVDIDFPLFNRLVHRLVYSSDVAAGQLALFQGASEAPISECRRSVLALLLLQAAARTEPRPTVPQFSRLPCLKNKATK
jgi:hypothetical protein